MLIMFMILHKLTRKQANQRYLNSKELIIMEKDVLQKVALATLSVEQASNDLDDIVSILFDLNDALNAKTKNNKNYIDFIDAISMKYKEMNYLFNKLSDISAELGKTKQQIFDAINNTNVQGDTETKNIQES